MSNTSLTITALNNLFEQMTQQTGLVFWIRSLDYQQVLYVSSNFQRYWDCSCENLYQNPAGWIETLVAEDKLRLAPEFTKRAHALAVEGGQDVIDTFLFRIHKLSNQSVVYIRDKAFKLVDKSDRAVAIAGIWMPLEEEAWFAMIKKQEPPQSPIEQGFIQFIQGILKLSPQPLQSILRLVTPCDEYRVYFEHQVYTLTLREAQCLYYSLQGYSAKQIAKQLTLSHRTVETYMEHIKVKLQCRNKLHLLGGVDISALPLTAMNL